MKKLRMAIIITKPKEKEILGGAKESVYLRQRILVKQILLKFDFDHTFQKH